MAYESWMGSISESESESESESPSESSFESNEVIVSRGEEVVEDEPDEITEGGLGTEGMKCSGLSSVSNSAVTSASHAI